MHGAINHLRYMAPWSQATSWTVNPLRQCMAISHINSVGILQGTECYQLIPVDLIEERLRHKQAMLNDCRPCLPVCPNADYSLVAFTKFQRPVSDS